MTLRRSPADDATVVVIGGGTMGAGIAEALIESIPCGDLCIVETDDSRAETTSNPTRAGLQRPVGAGIDSNTRPRARKHPSVGLPHTDGVARVVEAVRKDPALKCQIPAEASKTPTVNT
jgi:3-hydroxyacyl-CoA dehydrogenase